MKTLFFIPGAVFIACFLACNGSGGTGYTADDETVIAEADIGGEGGNAGDENFNLTIPENAFDRTVHLVISVGSQGQPFDDCAGSDVYTINGLPEFYNLPLTVMCKHYGNLNDTTLLADGLMDALSDSNQTADLYRYYEGRDSSGFFIAQLPAKTDTSSQDNSVRILSAQEIGRRKISVATSFAKIELATGLDTRIVVHTPEAYRERMETVGNRVISSLQSLGANLNNPDRTVAIEIQPYLPYWEWRVIENEKYIVARTDGKFIYRGILSIILVDASRIDRVEMEAQLGRFLFQHYVQRHFSPPTQERVRTDNVRLDRNLWLHTAIAGWSEIYFSGDNDYIPAYFMLNKKAPFHSAGLAFNVQDFHAHLNFGRGMCSLIKYLVRNHTDKEQMIMQFYGSILESEPVCHLTKLIDMQSQPVSTWWPGFLKDYLAGDVMDFLTPNLVEEIAVSWNIDSEDKKNWTSSETCKDICSIPERFSFDYSQMPENAELYMDVDCPSIAAGQYQWLAFHYNGSRLDFLGSADGQTLCVENIRSMCGKREDLVVVLANDFYQVPDLSGLTQIDVTAEIREKSEVQGPYNHGTIDVTIWATTRHSNEQEPTEGVLPLVWTGPGSMTSETVFTVDDEYGTTTGQQVHVQMTVTFDDLFSEILSFSGQYMSTNSTGKTMTMSITGEGPIGVPDDTQTYTTFQAAGPAACGYITSLTYNAEVYSGTNTLIGYSCHEDASLTLTFVKSGSAESQQPGRLFFP